MVDSMIGNERPQIRSRRIFHCGAGYVDVLSRRLLRYHPHVRNESIFTLEIASQCDRTNIVHVGYRLILNRKLKKPGFENELFQILSQSVSSIEL